MLDLGELSARVTVETTDADRNLSAFERKLLAVARTQVPDIAVDVATAVAEGALSELEAQLRGLPDGEASVDADTRAARGQLGDLEGLVRGLPDGEVTVRARGEGFDDLTADAAQGGAEAGEAAGESLSAGVIAAIATIPVAGAIVGIGAAIGQSLLDGLQNEVREDVLVARTGLDPAVAQRIGRAAGEAYAANFGESIEANFDTARAALQGGLLDPSSTARESEQIIASLSGVSDILGEDIPRVVRATATLLRSGLVGSADEAFDLLVKGQQNGANAAEDLLDTFTEYPAVLERLGLSGADSLGLISQGLQNGARDSDFVADALKEFQIRATDGSEASAAAFDILGINAEQATAKIARGGGEARDGLDEVLDGLRAIEDPVKRNEAAVGLFGTKAEDLGDALFALDLDTVAADLGTVEGAASGAISALGDNAAGELESAQRSIDIAADGIKGALAGAIDEPLREGAEFIAGNREAVVGFLLDIADAGLDVGIALVEGTAAGIEGMGELVASTEPALDALASLVDASADLAYATGRRGLSTELRDLADGIRETGDSLGGFDTTSADAADRLRTNLIDNGLVPVQEKLDTLGIDLRTEAAFTDATTRLAGAVEEIGYAADGTQLSVGLAGGAFDVTTEAGARLDAQIRTAVEALDAQTRAGEEAGRTTEELSADYAENRDALLVQLEAMGLTREEAERLADRYGAIPDKVTTEITARTEQALAALADVQGRIDRIKDKAVTLSITTVESLVRQETAMANRGNANPRTIDGTRALGGPTQQGKTYLVGEEGPELLYAETDGYVIPAGRTAEILSGGMSDPSPVGMFRGGVTSSVREGDVINVYETTSPRDTAEAIVLRQRIAEAEATL